MSLRKIFVLYLLIMALFSESCTYIRRALWHGKADITDYKIFSNRNIDAGIPQPWTVDYTNRNLSTQALTALLEYKPTALLIVQNQKIIFEKYFENFNEYTISNTFSVTKSIVSLLIGIAIQENLIGSLDDKVVKYLPELKENLSEALTIRHLLTMSAGLNFDEKYASLFSATTKAYYGTNLNKMVKKLKSVRKPGERYEYQSGATQLLAAILQKVSGMSLSDFASEKLWKKIGAEKAALWCLDKKNGTEKAFCCFCTNARDLARIGQLVLNNGKWNGETIIEGSYLDECFKPNSSIGDAAGNRCDFYGLHWWLMEYQGLKINYARGVNGQYLFVIPQKNAVIIRLGHLRSKNRDGYVTHDIYPILNAALEILE